MSNIYRLQRAAEALSRQFSGINEISVVHGEIVITFMNTEGFEDVVHFVPAHDLESQFSQIASDLVIRGIANYKSTQRI